MSTRHFCELVVLQRYGLSVLRPVNVPIVPSSNVTHGMPQRLTVGAGLGLDGEDDVEHRTGVRRGRPMGSSVPRASRLGPGCRLVGHRSAFARARLMTLRALRIASADDPC